MDPVSYHEPKTIEEAIDILADDQDAKCLAGGQTLVAGMNLGLVRPSALVSLRRIDELKEIRREPDGAVTVGAMATHRAIAGSTCFTSGLALVPDAARQIAHPAIRVMGTMGGSICHGDPVADYPGVLVALDAEIEAASVHGRRWIRADAFFVDFLTTSLRAGELVTRIRFPASPPQAVGVYEKFARADGDFATVSVALALAVEDGVCTGVGLAVGSCGSTPVRSRDAEETLLGMDLNDEAITQACAVLGEIARPMDDVRGSAQYRRMLIPRIVRRSFQRAAGAAKPT